MGYQPNEASAAGGGRDLQDSTEHRKRKEPRKKQGRGTPKEKWSEARTGMHRRRGTKRQACHEAEKAGGPATSGGRTGP